MVRSKGALLVVMIVLSSPAQAFISADQADGLASVIKSAQSMREKLRPALVDLPPIKILTDRLSREGEQIQMERGIDNIFVRLGSPDTKGLFQNLKVSLAEVPDELAERPSDSMLRHAVLRRYFSHLKATSESWEVNPQTGKGTVHVWSYRVGLEGTLMSVEHQIALVERDAAGRAVPIQKQVRSYRLSPSDPSVQRRWKALVTDLMTLGRIVEI